VAAKLKEIEDFKNEEMWKKRQEALKRREEASIYSSTSLPSSTDTEE
jgi:hypothetical protein